MSKIQNIKSLLLSGLLEQERAVFERFSDSQANPVFVVCSPRVGSTLIYQLLINKFGFAYISNFVNDFYGANPAVGVANQLVSDNNKYLVSYKSQYGKTLGYQETSEASAVFGNWYGGEHPSQLHSSDPLDTEKEIHMQNSLSAICGMTEATFVCKNPWNAFRIKSFSETFPNATFVWIRRGIDMASISDLENRYQRGKPEEVWNSATTSNYLEIQQRPYWEQVVLQQYYYSHAIGKDLQNNADGRFIDIWYEDLCTNTNDVLNNMKVFFEGLNVPLSDSGQVGQSELSVSAGSVDKIPDDFAKVKTFIHSEQKYKDLLYPR